MTNETTAITNQQVLADHSDERAEATARAGEDAGPAVDPRPARAPILAAGLARRFCAERFRPGGARLGRTDFSALELGLLVRRVADSSRTWPAAGAVGRWEPSALACDHAVHEVTGIWVLRARRRSRVAEAEPRSRRARVRSRRTHRSSQPSSHGRLAARHPVRGDAAGERRNDATRRGARRPLGRAPARRAKRRRRAPHPRGIDRHRRGACSSGTGARRSSPGRPARRRRDRPAAGRCRARTDTGSRSGHGLCADPRHRRHALPAAARPGRTVPLTGSGAGACFDPIGQAALNDGNEKESVSKRNRYFN